MSKFSERFKELRKSRNLSQQELANYLKTSKSSVNMYERGEREPGIEMLENIADYFNVDMDFLLGKSQTANHLLVKPFEQLPLAPRETQLLTNYRKLNSDEQQKADDYVENLVKVSEGSKPNIIQKPIAAFGGAETLTVDSDVLKAAIDAALKEKGLI